jgi:DNA polymerase-3 subunit gamma/tau
MATTNPEKIPATILSRVQSFQLSKISLEGITKRLKYVLDQEIKEGAEITYTDDAVLFVAKLANGGMRDALTLLEKSLSFSKDLTTENLVKALNLPNYDDYFLLLGACAKRDNVKITEIVDRVYNSGVNFQKWFEGFHGFVMNIVKYIFLQDIQKTVIPSYYSDKISKYGTNHVIICLRLANRVLELNNALKTTQYLQETALSYLCTIPKKEG